MGASLANPYLGEFVQSLMREVSAHATGPETELKLGCVWDEHIKKSALTLDNSASVTLSVLVDEYLRVSDPEHAVAQVTLTLCNTYG